MHNQRIRDIIRTIRDKREQLNYSQQYMAARMEISEKYYNKIELGHTRLTLEYLFKICEILDLSAEELLLPENGAIVSQTHRA